MARYHRDFTEGQVRMSLAERAQAAAVIATRGMDLPPGADRDAHLWAAAKVLGPIHTRDADPQPRASSAEVASWLD